MAIVLDEYGQASGIITMEDLVEEIVGDIRDEYDENENDLIRDLGNHTYDIDASIKLDDLNDKLHTNFQSKDYDSLAGFIIELLDKIPTALSLIHILFFFDIIEQLLQGMNRWQHPFIVLHLARFISVAHKASHAMLQVLFITAMIFQSSRIMCIVRICKIICNVMQYHTHPNT